MFSLFFGVSKFLRHTHRCGSCGCLHGTYTSRTLRVVKAWHVVEVGWRPCSERACNPQGVVLDVSRQRDRRCISHCSASARLTQGSGCQHANCRTCRGQTSPATFVASMVVMVWDVERVCGCSRGCSRRGHLCQRGPPCDIGHDGCCWKHDWPDEPKNRVPEALSWLCGIAVHVYHATI